MVQLPLTPYRNQSLFSDHYLADRLPKDNFWQTLIAETRPAMEKIAALYAAYTPSNKEGQIERELIRPVLEALGHTFEVMPSLQMPGSPQTPDYVFYHDQAALIANKGKMLTDALPTQRAYAIGEAEHWDCLLDVPTKGASAKLLTNGNPSYQIASYIQHSGLDWGILTNGRHWRLYHRTTAHKLDRFYDVDVPVLIATKDPAQFAWFFGFFRREAFRDTPAVGRGLDYILHESTSYAQNVSESLKTQVYKALLSIAQGFLDYPANHLSPDDPGTLKEIYDNSLILLYRLLFIFYAEARGLLPVGTNAGYNDEYSLFRIARSGAQAIDKGTPLLAKGAKLWQSLKDLFAIINGGNREFGVATFNGGLFDPAKHPFLEQYTVGDARLRQAIDELARANVPSMQTGSKKGDIVREFVDYRDLSERHLGTIYEGLLEFRLLPRDPDTQMKFALMAGDADQWTVDIRNDKGERKVTGSYYTPDYIVKYIVEQTVLPVLDAAIAQEPDYDAKINAVLAVKVLDPAMGSGHFLVEATEQIARSLLNLTPPENDTAAVHDLAYWKRRVVQSCIFGVDLNPLAVELAKLSLWLATVAKDQPLSFLDHHLRVGNALIGAQVADLDMLGDAAFQAQVRQALVQVGTIEASAAADAQAVKEQERIYATLRTALTERYRIVADAYVARYFGADYPAGEWGPFRDWLIGRNSDPQPRYDAWRASIAAMARDRHFFHWELEFPEAFFAADGTPKEDGAGFDAVIGNPPYISVINISKEDRSYLLKRYQTATGRFDTYIVFTERGLQLARDQGKLGYIIPIKFAIYANGRELRSILLEKTQVRKLVNVSQANVFHDPSTYPCILIVDNIEASPDSEFAISNISESGERAFSEGLEHKAFIMPYSRIVQVPEHIISPNLDETRWRLFGRCDRISTTVGTHFTIEQCIRIGNTQARKELVIDDPSAVEPKVRPLVHRMIDGEEIEKYFIDWQGKYLVYDKARLYNPKSAAVLDVPKVLVKRIAPTLQCFPDVGPSNFYYPLNTVYALVPQSPNSDMSLFFIAAILNGRLLDWLYKILFEAISVRGGYVEYREHIKYLPVRRIVFATATDVRKALLSAGIALCDAGNEETVISFVTRCLSSSPEQSDVVHDLLAHLAQRMIDLHTERRTAHEHFRGWLRDNQGVPVDTFKPKSALDAFHTGTYRDFAAWMEKNKHKIRYQDDPTYLEAFTHASAAVQRIAARIATTDRLIDRIVYALYGLTEDEIAIVEGSAS